MTSRASNTVEFAVTGLRGIPGVMGGIETHCEELLPRLAALDSSLRITVLGRSPYLAEARSAIGGVEVVALPAPRRQSLEAITSTFVSIVWARWRGIRHVHIHGIGPGLMAPLARMLGMRVIVTHHGEDYERAKWGRVARAVLHLGERASARAAHRLICVAPSLADRIVSRFPHTRPAIRYIPNGVPTTPPPDSATCRSLLASFGLEEGRYILAVGRLVPEKGHDYLVEAYRRSGTTRPLVIVGAADHDSAYATSLIESGDDNIRFLGRQSREALASLYAGAALFVLPSFHEGLPIVALEAANAGVPMLLSDIVPNRDIGLPDVSYFPVGDAERLADALRMPPERFAINGQAISARFDWNRITSATLEVYRDVMDQ